MPRIPIITPESDLNAEQKRVLEGLLGRRGGRIPGPYRFTLHNPEVTEFMHPFGELLRLRSSFPLRTSELAIIVTARMWDSDYIFHSHAPNGVKNGLPQSVVDALVRGERPVFEKEDEEVIYDYLTELFAKHAISDKTHARAKALFGIPAIVELTALSGYYGMVAMQLLAHEMPLPEGATRLQPRK
ncbi:MAG TPA: carboxymuconolactone decarboxylase family protein [Burkholderiales bacterium]|nr:carboxymuconolactone decarboxylase family protein [Burkholderiales bacterium]